MRPTPAGRGGTARCCSPYNAILERLDTMDVRIQQAVDDANAAMSAAVIQAGNAAQSASDALAQAVIAAGKADDAAADAADAAQDAADAAQALSDINDTISTTLSTTLGLKVDKLTTAGLHLYSHTGATQGEEEPIDGITANSIPIRDGNGRMHAADPASGATDKTLVTANWVSQTGGSAPNNLLHTNGDETFSGHKSATELQYQNTRPYIFQRVTASNKWFKVFRLTGTGRRVLMLDLYWAHQTYNGYGIGRAVLAAIGANTTAKWLYRSGNASAFTADTIFIGIDSSGIDIWIKGGYFVYSELTRMFRGNVEENIGDVSVVYDGTAYDSIDTSAYANYAYGVD